MRMVFIDDSIPFDGYSPSSQPLGGLEKAFANLPTVLAMRGHDVAVFNRCEFPVTVHGARWEIWETERPAETDVLIAFRRPRLLDAVATAKRRILWAAGPSSELDTPAAQEALARHGPLVVFLCRSQRELWANPLKLETVVIEPGLASSYLEDEPMSPANPPVAVCTTHPLAGVEGLLKLWVGRIRPEMPTAELHLYSSVLDRAQLGAAVPPEFAAVFTRAKSGASHGVVIKRPQADPGMAEAYRRARVHLHPGAPSDIYGFTLSESQATGLPAAALATNPIVIERIADGQTGSIAASETAFVSAAISLLGDTLAFERMSANARLLKRGRTWAIAAAEWENHFA
jgi:glycosyltransferase involved in cell wall biosynthesis